MRPTRARRAATRLGSKIAALAALVASVALAGAPGVAWAGDAVEESEALVQHGVELRTRGQNREALDAFEQAYALHPTPRTRAQIALASQAIGAWIEAERGLDEALRAEGDPWIERYRGPLEAARATVRTHLGWLKVATNVTGAELVVNGVGVARLPAEPLRVVAGTVVVGVRAPGYLAARRRVEITPESPVREVLIMEPVVEPRVAPADAPASGPPALSAAASADSKRVFDGGLALVGGGLLAVTGVVALVFRETNAAVYNDDARCRVGVLTREEQCGEYSIKAEAALGVELVAFVGAGVLAVTGVAILAAPRPGKPPRVEVACGPLASLGLSCRGEF